MGTIKRDDIVAAWIDGKLVCKKCIIQEEWDILKDKDDFVLKSDRDKTDDLMFCDRCEERF